MKITKYRLKKAWEVFRFHMTVGYFEEVSMWRRLRAGFSSAKWYFLYPEGSFGEKTK